MVSQKEKDRVYGACILTGAVIGGVWLGIIGGPWGAFAGVYFGVNAGYLLAGLCCSSSGSANSDWINRPPDDYGGGE